MHTAGRNKGVSNLMGLPGSGNSEVSGLEFMRDIFDDEIQFAARQIPQFNPLISVDRQTPRLVLLCIPDTGNAQLRQHFRGHLNARIATVRKSGMGKLTLFFGRLKVFAGVSFVSAAHIVKNCRL